jgi:methyltransferase family protein
MYAELAHWWPLLSPPAHYVEEAADLLPHLLNVVDSPATLLELGSGGGSLAYHFKHSLELTLTDRSPEMLAVSRQLNPECEHIEGDMRTLDLGREFDIVFIHDAITYATDAAFVHDVLATAHRHCRPGGAVVIVPDFVRETYEPDSDVGGEDGADGRGLRYVEWSWDPDPNDTTYEVVYAFILRHADGSITVESDAHREGLFARAEWLAWLENAGFTASTRTDPWNRDVLTGIKRPG